MLIYISLLYIGIKPIIYRHLAIIRLRLRLYRNDRIERQRRARNFICRWKLRTISLIESPVAQPTSSIGNPALPRVQEICWPARFD